MMKTNVKDGIMTIFLEGHIDSSNAAAVEKEIMQALASQEHTGLVVDLKDLEYISSAGLRILLKVRKKYKSLSAINASSSVYEIFEVTGFTELIDVSKAMRELSVEGCDVVGEGANGIVYRIDRDTIVKVYKSADSTDAIFQERELSRTAFLLGIPTAISYDVVRVGNSYGSVFELLNAKSLAELIRESEDNLEFVAQKSVEIAKIIHSTPAPKNLPDEFETVNRWIKDVQAYLTAEEYNKLLALVEALPRDGMMIHGDYHIKNLLLQGEETLLIDMDTLSTGHPIFELAFMYNAYKGFGIADPMVVEKFMGFSSELAYRLWRRMLALYIGTDDKKALDETEDKAALIGLLRLMRRTIRKDGDSPQGKAFIAASNARIKELLKTVDSLEFTVYEG